MKNLNELSTNEKMLILKAIIAKCNNEYKKHEIDILNEVLTSETLEVANDFGTFKNRHTDAKTVQHEINKRLEGIRKLQKEIDELNMYKYKNRKITNAKDTLTSYCSQQATDEATRILNDII